MALKWSLAFGEQLMRDYFEKGKPGWMLSGGSLIDADPTAAHLYVSTLYLAAILVYVETVLHANESVCAEVRNAIHDGLTQMQFPNGDRPDDRLLRHLQGVEQSMFQAIVRDIDSQSAADPQAFRPKPLQATECLYGLLKAAYFGNSDAVFLGHSPDQVHLAMQLQSALDEAPISILLTLKNSTHVRLVEA